MRNEAYLAYAAVTRDEAQRSIRPFYDAVKINPAFFTRPKSLVGIDGDERLQGDALRGDGA